MSRSAPIICTQRVRAVFEAKSRIEAELQHVQSMLELHYALSLVERSGPGWPFPVPPVNARKVELHLLRARRAMNEFVAAATTEEVQRGA